MRTIGMRTIGMRIIGMEDNWHAENWHGGQLASIFKLWYFLFNYFNVLTNNDCTQINFIGFKFFFDTNSKAHISSLKISTMF